MRKTYMDSEPKNSSGLGICSVLAIVLIVLKLVGAINRSWLLVLCPLWIKLLLAAIVLVIVEIIDSNFRNKRNRSRRVKW